MEVSCNELLINGYVVIEPVSSLTLKKRGFSRSRELLCIKCVKIISMCYFFFSLEFWVLIYKEKSFTFTSSKKKNELLFRARNAIIDKYFLFFFLRKFVSVPPLEVNLNRTLQIKDFMKFYEEMKADLKKITFSKSLWFGNKKGRLEHPFSSDWWPCVRLSEVLEIFEKFMFRLIQAIIIWLN